MARDCSGYCVNSTNSTNFAWGYIGYDDCGTGGLRRRAQLPISAPTKLITGDFQFSRKDTPLHTTQTRAKPPAMRPPPPPPRQNFEILTDQKLTKKAPPPLPHFSRPKTTHPQDEGPQSARQVVPTAPLTPYPRDGNPETTTTLGEGTGSGLRQNYPRNPKQTRGKMALYHTDPKTRKSVSPKRKPKTPEKQCTMRGEM